MAGAPPTNALALEHITLMKQRYQRVFSSPEGQTVLTDLMRHCRAMETAIMPTARETDIALGRQEVWLYIQNFLNLPISVLYGLKTGRPYNPHVIAQGDEDGDT